MKALRIGDGARSPLIGPSPGCGFPAGQGVSWSSVQTANNLPSGLWRKNGVEGFAPDLPRAISGENRSCADGVDAAGGAGWAPQPIQAVNKLISDHLPIDFLIESPARSNEGWQLIPSVFDKMDLSKTKLTNW
jgi:hypothetical protein